MKITVQKFFLFAFILLEFVSAAVFAGTPAVPKPVLPDTDAELRIKITVSITIGRKRDCNGWGICDFSISIDRTAPNSFTSAMYVDDYNRNIIVFEIDKARGMSPETYTKYFSSGTFLMEDDSPIPSDVLRQLELTGSKTLIAGKHKVTERNGVLFVSIPMK